MTNREVHDIIQFVNYPMLIAQRGGQIVARNSSFRLEFGDYGSLNHLLETDEWDSFLGLCSRSHTKQFQILKLPMVDQRSREYRIEGSLLRHKEGESPTLLILAFHPKDMSVRQFKILKQKIDALTQQISRTKKLESERIQILEAETRARKKAEAASRLKDEFLATISHELRTPLTSIVGWLDMLEQGWVSADEQAEVISTIRKNAKVQQELIDDLLDLAAINRRSLSLTASSVNVVDLLDDIKNSLRSIAKQKTVEIFVLSYQPDMSIQGDVERLRQVFSNILSNAVKYSYSGGRVYIRIRPLDTEIEVKVTDEGSGIEAEFLPYVFEKFLQEDGSHTRRYGGLGLGLSIAKYIVEQHGGKINAFSSGKDKGSTFAVTLPISAVQTNEVLIQKS